MSGIARRYAKALFGIAGGDAGRARGWAESLAMVSSLFGIKDSARILKNPIMPKDLKKNLLEYGLEKSSAAPEVRNFVHGMIDAGRVMHIPAASHRFEQLLDELEGRVTARVVSAVPMNDDGKADLARTLGAIARKNVVIENEVNESLLGGFVAYLGNFRIDMCLSSKIDGLALDAVSKPVR